MHIRDSHLIKLTPWGKLRPSNTSNLENQIVHRLKRSRKVLNSRIVKRSITVSPAHCFGPKITSPDEKKKKMKKVSNKKKISSSTLKSKQTNFSSSKRLRELSGGNQNQRSNSISKPNFVQLCRIPEMAENDDGILTIMDI